MREACFSIEGKDRAEAREAIKRLERDKTYVVETLKDGRRIRITTKGRKKAVENGMQVGCWDFFPSVEGMTRKLNYVDDFFVDLIRKREACEESIPILLEALERVVNMEDVDQVIDGLPEWVWSLPGESPEYLCKVMKWLAIQEDVNYWGTNPKTGEPYDGRYKPMKALKEYFQEGASLSAVFRKHRLR